MDLAVFITPVFVSLNSVSNNTAISDNLRNLTFCLSASSFQLHVLPRRCCRLLATAIANRGRKLLMNTQRVCSLLYITTNKIHRVSDSWIGERTHTRVSTTCVARVDYSLCEAQSTTTWAKQPTSEITGGNQSQGQGWPATLLTSERSQYLAQYQCITNA